MRALTEIADQVGKRDSALKVVFEEGARIGEIQDIPGVIGSGHLWIPLISVGGLPLLCRSISKILAGSLPIGSDGALLASSQYRRKQCHFAFIRLCYCGCSSFEPRTVAHVCVPAH